MYTYRTSCAHLLAYMALCRHLVAEGSAEHRAAHLAEFGRAYRGLRTLRARYAGFDFGLANGARHT